MEEKAENFTEEEIHTISDIDGKGLGPGSGTFSLQRIEHDESSSDDKTALPKGMQYPVKVFDLDGETFSSIRTEQDKSSPEDETAMSKEAPNLGKVFDLVSGISSNRTENDQSSCEDTTEITKEAQNLGKAFDLVSEYHSTDRTVLDKSCSDSENETAMFNEAQNTGQVFEQASNTLSTQEIQHDESSSEDETRLSKEAQNTETVDCSAENLGYENDSSEDQQYSNVSEKSKNSLPYFKLPKPDLEGYIQETSQKLSIALKTLHASTSSSPSMTENIITFDIIETLKPIDKFKNKFMNFVKNEKLGAHHASECSTSEISVLDCKAPSGLKHIILKEKLKKEIGEKKFLAFKRFNQIQALEEEMCEDSNDSAHESGLETDDDEDEIAPFDQRVLEYKNSGDIDKDEFKPSENQNEAEVFDLTDSDDEDIMPKKSKCLPLEDESDEESTNSIEELAEPENNSIEELVNPKYNSIEELVEPEKNAIKESLDHENSIDKSVHLKKASMENFVDKKAETEVDYKNCSIIDSGSTSTENEPTCSEKNSLHQKPGFFLENEGTPSSSYIPSYQPAGGFLHLNNSISSSRDEKNQGSEDENGNHLGNIMPASCDPLHGFPDETVLSSTGDNSSSYSDVSQDNVGPKFAQKLDDLPVQFNDSDFSFRDVASICSGPFKDFSEGEGETGLEAPAHHPAPKVVDFFDDEAETGSEAPSHHPAPKVVDFFDDEAELSGDENSSDEEEADADEYDAVAIDEDLPSDEEQQERIAELYRKRLHDDDVQNILQIKERFLEGELGSKSSRARKFMWSKTNTAALADDQDVQSDEENEPALEDPETIKFNIDKTQWQIRSKDEKEENVCLGAEDFSCSRKIFKTGALNSSSQGNVKKRTRGSAMAMDEAVLKKFKLADSAS